jgi:exodeoxyribonuclease VII large subunit
MVFVARRLRRMSANGFATRPRTFGPGINPAIYLIAGLIVQCQAVASPPPISRTIYTPSELNREVRLHLEAGFQILWIEGEISNLAKPASGHIYFSIKDDKAQIRCAMFRPKAMLVRTPISNGSQVLVRARISLYEPRGEYQLLVDAIEPAGEGLLRQQYEALKKQLQAEGLFATERKQPLPAMATRFAIITSASGAVIQDFLQVLERRWPLARVRLYATSVQGEQAPAQLLAALRAADEQGWAQVLILARGGGSLEDLWAFNDETLARAIVACQTPVVSAIGHETDFTIADFVADLRAPTPSAAAELVSPDQIMLRERINALSRRVQQQFNWIMRNASQRYDHALIRLTRLRPDRQWQLQQLDLQRVRARLQRQLRTQLTLSAQRLLQLQHRLRQLSLQQRQQQQQQQLANLQRRLQAATRKLLQQQQELLHGRVRTLQAMGPDAVLQRGYALVIGSSQQTGQALYKAQQFSQPQTVRLQFHSFAISANTLGFAADDLGSEPGVEQPGNDQDTAGPGHDP